METKPDVTPTVQEGGPRNDPFSQIQEKAKDVLVQIVPATASIADTPAFLTIVQTFAGDVLSEKNIGGFSFHRLSPEQQQKALGEATPASLFENLSESLKDFYSRKLSELLKGNSGKVADPLQ